MASAGVTQAQWDRVQTEVRRQAARARVSERALIAAAEATGARFAASGRFSAVTLQRALVDVLETHADQIAALQARLDGFAADRDPDMAARFAAARAALDEGRLHEADQVLSEISLRDLASLQAADAEVERRRLRAGETIASRGQVAFLQADYLLAANHYARAAETAPESALDARWQYRTEQGLSLHERGRRFGDQDALLGAIRVYREEALPLAQRDSAPRNWAATQNNLGLTNALLGERGDRGQLEQAVAAFGSVLEIYTRRDEPDRWASAQKNLAGALTLLNERGGDASLSRAAAAYQAAASVWPRERDVVEWAGIQLSYANTLRIMGQSGSRALLLQSVDALEEIVAHLPRESDPDVWAMAQGNLGITLTALSQGRGRDGERAVAALRLALEEMREDDKPALWAQAQFNLGALLVMQAEANPRALEPGLAALAAAERVLTPESFPRPWAMMRMYQALGYSIRAQNGDASALPQAIRAAQDALEQFEAVGDAGRANGARQVLQRLNQMR